jgi:molecular chaperone DnaK
VYDFGGGTFDISILEVGENVVQVISTNGDTHLGGDDVDDRIINWLIAEFKKDTGIDVGGDKMVLQRLKDAAEKAKIELSNAQETDGSTCRSSPPTPPGPKHLQSAVARQARADDRGPRRAHAEPVKKALADAKKTPADIHEVVLVGGSTRIPLVQETVKKFFGKEPHRA